MYADREDNRNLMMKVWQKVLMMPLISEGVGSGVQVGGQGLDYEDEWCIYANRRADSPRVSRDIGTYMSWGQDPLNASIISVK